MKSLKIAVLAAVAIFLSACDNASHTTPTGDSDEAVGAAEAVGPAQTLLEKPDPPRVIKVCNSAQELADAYLEAQNNKDRQALLDLVFWDNVTDRKQVENRTCAFLGRNTLSDVLVTPIKKSFQEHSMKGFEASGEHLVPNLLVGAVLTPKSEKGDGQVEIGRHEGRWYMVAYIPALAEASVAR